MFKQRRGGALSSEEPKIADKGVWFLSEEVAQKQEAISSTWRECEGWQRSCRGGGDCTRDLINVQKKET